MFFRTFKAFFFVKCFYIYRNVNFYIYIKTQKTDVKIHKIYSFKKTNKQNNKSTKTVQTTGASQDKPDLLIYRTVKS